jgi:DNA mismatch repair protein MutS
VLLEAGVTTTTVPFRSILSERPGDGAASTDPSVFADLNLDQVFAGLTAGRDEYDLMPYFGAPLHDVQAVEYRHQILRDMEDEALSAALAEFADQMRDMRKCLEQSAKLRYRYQKESWFLDAARIYAQAVRALAGALTAINPSSRGFTAFREYLTAYSGSEAFTGLTADIERVTEALASVRYCINIRGSRVKVTRYEGEEDYGQQVQRTFAKFAQRAAKDYRAGFRNWPEMNHVEAHILDLAARLYPDVFGALDEFCARHAPYHDETIRVFDREVQFYAAYLAFIGPMKKAGLEFCYPDVSAGSKRISVHGCFDLALAAKLRFKAAAVVRNDFYLAGGERIFVVTGPNQGGKTTFARTFGQLHHLASLGYPVPAREATLFLPDRVFTHFEREEDLATLRGKFEDELVRIRDVLDQATGNSVVVMNESFASTTLRDAARVGERVLDRMTRLGLLGVYVTFVDELASISDACVSMVATVVPDNPAERTFELVRKPADGLAYAAAIAGKYGLTYRQLKERLAEATP